MSATIQDIARHLQISHTTVSRVLNGRDDHFISAATRERVLQAASTMNYQPNRVAKALASGRTHVVEFLTHYVHPAYFSRVVQAMKNQFAETPYELHIVETHDWNTDQWARGGKNGWPSDGLIVLEERQHLQHLIEMRQVTVPMVSIGSNCVTDIDHVSIDTVAGTQLAVNHLLDSGYRRITYLCARYFENDLRAIAYQETMQSTGASSETMMVEMLAGETMRGAARRVVRSSIALDNHPEALFCMNDEIAIGALCGLRDLGLRIPDDIALVGCDGIEETEYHDPPISTLVVPYEDMTRYAWDFLQRRLENPSLPIQSVTLVPELSIRASSRPTVQ